MMLGNGFKEKRYVSEDLECSSVDQPPRGPAADVGVETSRLRTFEDSTNIPHYR